MFFGKKKKTAISIVLAIACVMVTCGITSDPAYAADMAQFTEFMSMEPVGVGIMVTAKQRVLEPEAM